VPLQANTSAVMNKNGTVSLVDEYAAECGADKFADFDDDSSLQQSCLF